MVLCLQASSHYLYQLIINRVLWHFESNFTRNVHGLHPKNKITTTSPRADELTWIDRVCIWYAGFYQSMPKSLASCYVCCSVDCHYNDTAINTLRPRQNGRHFPDDIFKCIFFNENLRISHKISLTFVPKVRINNIPALVQIMAWRRLGDKPLSEPMMLFLPTHICVTRPQWVKPLV